MGYDAGKKVKGRGISTLWSTPRAALACGGSLAAIQDRNGAALVFDRIRHASIA